LRFSWLLRLPLQSSKIRGQILQEMDLPAIALNDCHLCREPAEMLRQVRQPPAATADFVRRMPKPVGNALLFGFD
jgi:hypothetical protein